jgi:hypothetical protein
MADIGITNEPIFGQFIFYLHHIAGTPDFLPFYSRLRGIIEDVKFARDFHPLGYIVPWSLVYGMLPVGYDLPCLPYQPKSGVESLFSNDESFSSQSSILARFSNSVLTETTPTNSHPRLISDLGGELPKLNEYALKQYPTDPLPNCLEPVSVYYHHMHSSRSSSVLKKIANGIIVETDLIKTCDSFMEEYLSFPPIDTDSLECNDNLNSSNMRESSLVNTSTISHTRAAASSFNNKFGNGAFPSRIHPHNLRNLNPKPRIFDPMKNHVPFNGSAKFFPNESESVPTSAVISCSESSASQPLVKNSAVGSSSTSGCAETSKMDSLVVSKYSTDAIAPVIHEPSMKHKSLTFIVPLKACGTKKNINQEALPQVKDEVNSSYNNMMKKTRRTRGPNKRKGKIFVQMKGIKGQVVDHFATAAEESHLKVI